MKRLSAMILSIWYIVLALTCMRICFVLFLCGTKQYISYRSEIQATLLRYAELVLSAGKMMSYFFIHMPRYLQMLYCNFVGFLSTLHHLFLFGIGL
jgi:hypothetical protein